MNIILDILIPRRVYEYVVCKRKGYEGSIEPLAPVSSFHVSELVSLDTSFVVAKGSYFNLLGFGINLRIEPNSPIDDIATYLQENIHV